MNPIEEKRDEFRKILNDLADPSQTLLQDEKNCDQMYQRLEALYWATPHEKERKGFRHFYSDIFSVISDIKDEDPDEPSRSIDVLGQNLSILRKNYEAQNQDSEGNLIDISDRIDKLYDHVNLDIARITYLEKMERDHIHTGELSDVETKINQADSRITKLEELLNQTEEDIKKTTEENIKKTKDAQKEYIAILGIFAAVALTFTGGITFSVSVLQNIQSSSAYRLVLITLVIGIVLFNILFALFYYIHYIVYGSEKRAFGRNIFWRTNIILISLIVVVCIAWKCGIIEHRNMDMIRVMKSIAENIP